MVSRMFRIETEVDRERRDLLRARLLETNTAASPVLRALRGTPAEREVPLHVWALDSSSGLAGGLVGHTWAAWLQVTYLWVDDRHRGTGLGSHLLGEAERIAREERACGSARLETWDFQAPDFYKKQGYEVVCVIPDYPPGITEYTLTKKTEVNGRPVHLDRSAQAVAPPPKARPGTRARRVPRRRERLLDRLGDRVRLRGLHEDDRRAAEAAARHTGAQRAGADRRVDD